MQQPAVARGSVAREPVQSSEVAGVASRGGHAVPSCARLGRLRANGRLARHGSLVGRCCSAAGRLCAVSNIARLSSGETASRHTSRSVAAQGDMFCIGTLDSGDQVVVHQITLERKKLPPGNTVLEYDDEGFAAAMEPEQDSECIVVEDFLDKVFCADQDGHLYIHLAGRRGAPQLVLLFAGETRQA